MPTQKNKVVGRYGRRKRRKGFRVKFRFGRKFFYLTLLAVIAGGIFYFLFISDKFEIKEVNITGLRAVNEEEVLNAANNILDEKKLVFAKARNHFLFSGESLGASLLRSFPKVASVGIEKTTDTLNISLEERDVLGVWCLASRDLASPDRIQDCFYFDKTGVVFEEAPKSVGSLIIVIDDERDVEKNLGNSVLSREQVVFVQDAQGLVSRNFPFSVRTFVITKYGEYEILTSEGWRVLLDKSAGADYQLSNLKYVLDEEVKTRRGELEYVDLRLGNKVYYKYVEILTD
jgi:hypothetical protein